MVCDGSRFSCTLSGARRSGRSCSPGEAERFGPLDLPLFFFCSARCALVDQAFLALLGIPTQIRGSGLHVLGSVPTGCISPPSLLLPHAAGGLLGTAFSQITLAAERGAPTMGEPPGLGERCWRGDAKRWPRGSIEDHREPNRLCLSDDQVVGKEDPANVSDT